MKFHFGTMNSRNFTIQRNDDLATTNWVSGAHFTGNGSLMKVVAPVTNAPGRNFRLRQP